MYCRSQVPGRDGRYRYFVKKHNYRKYLYGLRFLLYGFIIDICHKPRYDTLQKTQISCFLYSEEQERITIQKGAKYNAYCSYI